MVRFSLASLKASPWKNGGGVTREIVVWPDGADLNDFIWRVSVATIAASGPFSSFPGIDRVIMLLQGDGIELTGQTIVHRLDEVGVPFAFSGDEELRCTLLGSPSSDFNVMSRRGKLNASVTVLDADTRLSRGCGGLVMALDGVWRIDGEELVAAQGVWWTKGAAPFELCKAIDAPAMLVCVIFESCD